MMTEEDSKFLERLKKRRIAFCEKHGLPIPAFDKEEDFFIDERIPCPTCGSKDGYIARGTFSRFYSAEGNPGKYILATEGESDDVECLNCHAIFLRERLWKKD